MARADRSSQGTRCLRDRVRARTPHRCRRVAHVSSELMSDSHPVRTHITGATVAGLLVALILWALGCVGPVLRALWSAASWLGHGLATSISLPVWLVFVVVGYAVAVTVMIRRHRIRSVRSPEAPAAFRPGGPPQEPRELERLQAKVMRAMGEADGGTPTVEDLADDLGISQLRLEQTLEELESIGYLEIIRHVADGPVVDVTRAGRDYLIAKRLV